MIEELRPVMNVPPERSLIGNVSDDRLLALLFIFENTSQGVVHGNADRVKALPHIEETLSAGRPSNDTFRLLGLLIFCFLSKSIKYLFSYLPKLFVV